MARPVAQTAITSVTLTKAKLTKNTVRYEGPAPIEVLYVQKSAFGSTIPDSIRVTVTAA